MSLNSRHCSSYKVQTRMIAFGLAHPTGAMSGARTSGRDGWHQSIRTRSSEPVAHGPSLKERLDKPTLDKLYNTHGLSTVQIAERFCTRSPQILKLMSEYGIERRSRGGKT